ncbi:peptide ABC transporter substrate-binding protein [Leptolyngbya sp. FACHB-17]|uniref:peptide ABC transporter substrate-binding protein n=1 Tax=unclassified Leptolyngbya TaxID=2650499 RepID=UPI00168001A1|nr:peptide ABC transporter substrate-binding protein [Leptolyngbya sp. FACHB-17]MBD2078432.1 peptide ABC transporter substrate-binding protein [Leptolyngbya sp. FACHB-17]
MVVTLKSIQYNISAPQIVQAREWMLDCSWRETEDELEELFDLEVVLGVEKHFDGGWRGFLESAIAV